MVTADHVTRLFADRGELRLEPERKGGGLIEETSHGAFGAKQFFHARTKFGIAAARFV